MGSGTAIVLHKSGAGPGALGDHTEATSYGRTGGRKDQHRLYSSLSTLAHRHAHLQTQDQEPRLHVPGSAFRDRDRCRASLRSNGRYDTLEGLCWTVRFRRGGMSLSLVPGIFNINGGLPSCAPCDPTTLPGIDRWAVSTERSAWNIASWVGEFGLVAGTWYELYKLPNGTKHLAASVEATAWNFGVTRLAKAVFNRNRPVLYTEDGIEAQESLTSHRSMYSGHTSTAFVLATSYVLSMSDKNGLDRFWPLIAAASVGAMRLAAGKHFPTDVLVGAVAGSGTAIVLHEIRF